MVCLHGWGGRGGGCSRIWPGVRVRQAVWLPHPIAACGIKCMVCCRLRFEQCGWPDGVSGPAAVPEAVLLVSRRLQWFHWWLQSCGCSIVGCTAVVLDHLTVAAGPCCGRPYRMPAAYHPWWRQRTPPSPSGGSPAPPVLYTSMCVYYAS